MENKNALNTIYQNLKAGYSYGKMISGPRFEYYTEVLEPIDAIYTRKGAPLIKWTHYGSNANAFNKTELKWILNTIFKLTPVEFLKQYELLTPEKQRYFVEL